MIIELSDFFINPSLVEIGNKDSILCRYMAFISYFYLSFLKIKQNYPRARANEEKLMI